MTVIAKQVFLSSYIQAEGAQVLYKVGTFFNFLATLVL